MIESESEGKNTSLCLIGQGKLNLFGLNSILLINRHIQQDKDIYGTGSDRKLKAYINHLLKKHFNGTNVCEWWIKYTYI